MHFHANEIVNVFDWFLQVPDATPQVNDQMSIGLTSYLADAFNMGLPRLGHSQLNP